jgi:hypothetical protein
MGQNIYAEFVPKCTALKNLLMTGFVLYIGAFNYTMSTFNAFQKTGH